MTIIQIAIGTFGTVTKGLSKRLEDLEIRGRVEIIQTTALLRTARIMKRVLESSERTLADADVKNCQGINNNNNNNNDNISRELKKQWNMKVTVIPIVIWAPGKIPKGLESARV